MNPKIPECMPSFYELANQMRINQEIVMKEISAHVDKEIERLKKSIERIHEPRTDS